MKDKFVITLGIAGFIACVIVFFVQFSYVEKLKWNIENKQSQVDSLTSQYDYDMQQMYMYHRWYPAKFYKRDGQWYFQSVYFKDSTVVLMEKLPNNKETNQIEVDPVDYILSGGKIPDWYKIVEGDSVYVKRIIGRDLITVKAMKLK